MTIHAPPPDARGVRPQGAVGARRLDRSSSSAICELSFEKHADTPERAEAPSQSLELHVTNPRRKDDCGGQPAIEAQTLVLCSRELILCTAGGIAAKCCTRLAS